MTFLRLLGQSRLMGQEMNILRRSHGWAARASFFCNAERDLWRHVRRRGLTSANDSAAYPIDISLKGADGQLRMQHIDVILPHQLIHQMYLIPDLFNTTMIGPLGEDGLHELWVQSSRMSWAACHPGRRHFVDNPKTCIPLRLHGDSIPVTKSVGMLILNFCSCMVRHLPAFESRQLLCAVRASKLLNLDDVMDVLKWSFNALMTGIMPVNDHLGHPLTGELAKDAGKAVAGPYKLLLCHVVGDWEFLRDYLDLENHYNVDEFCFLCRATKSHTCNCAWNYAADAPWVSTARSNAEFMKRS